jgi:cellulose biosynthesis protein BcsQ
MSTETSLTRLRAAIEDALHPRRLILRRGHDGAIDLRVLADAFADAEDPLSVLEQALQQQDLQLPERTLTLLQSPDDLQEGDEQRLFSQRLVGVPTWADALELEPQTPAPDDRGLPEGVKVVAFWGLKGGVGRSTALAHVAVLLARRQHKVLAIDLDLESPALVPALTGYSDSGSRFEDLIRCAAEPGIDDAQLVRLIEQALLPAVIEAGSIEILGPVKADAPFVHALLGPLSPTVLYRGARPPMRRLLQAAVQASQADIVLLDARSGYCDESAIAVLDLADEVVMFASPSPSTYRSLAPALDAFERSRRARGRPGLVHIVAGMLPAGENARADCIEQLEYQLQLARLQVDETLQTPPAERPPEITVIPIDYAPRIVENDGGLSVSGATEGYRDLAERILPPPLPRNLVPDDPNWVGQVVREAEIPVPQAESEGNVRVLADLFTRTSDLDRFLRHDTCLVLGAKGTGKSYLRRICLEQPGLLEQHSGRRGPNNLAYVEGYASPRAGRGADPPASAHLLRELDARFPTRWDECWSALALARVLTALSPNRGAVPPFLRPVALADDGMDELLLRVAAAAQEQEVLDAISALLGAGKPLVVSDAWRALDAWCEREGKQVALLFDDLDVALGESPEAIERRRAMIIGLLDQANASWMSTRYVGVKIFLRRDIFDSLAAEEQAKYLSRSVTLQWRADDIWRLIIRALAVASAKFRKHVEEQGISIAGLDDLPRDDWEPILKLIWGDRLGGGESQTRSTVWAERRLSDGNGRLYPRAALWLLDFAVRARRNERIDGPPLLDPKSLRAAMPDVSGGRLDELLTETATEQRERVLRIEGFKSYLDRPEFLEALKQAGEPEPAAALTMLEALGIVETGSRRDKTPTVRIVDLYAFAPKLRIDRLGRR